MHVSALFWKLTFFSHLQCVVRDPPGGKRGYFCKLSSSASSSMCDDRQNTCVRGEKLILSLLKKLLFKLGATEVLKGYRAPVAG